MFAGLICVLCVFIIIVQGFVVIMSKYFRCQLYNKRDSVRQFDCEADDLTQLNFNIGCLVGHFTTGSFNSEDLCVTIRLIQKL